MYEGGCEQVLLASSFITFASRPFTVDFAKRLPNLAALVRGANHRVADLALESLREGRHVRERAVDAEARERVRVGRDSQARGLGANVTGPDLRPAEDESLLGPQARDGLRA